MSMLKALLAGGFGAAAYNVYRESDGLMASTDLATGLYDAFQRRSSANLSEMARMQKQVEDLQSALLKSFHDRQGGTIVIHSPNKTGTGTMAAVVVVVGGVAVYLRFVKGWKFSDLMYVTRSSLQNMRESLSQGLKQMSEQFEEKARELYDKMAVVGRAQDEMMTKQDEMDNTLRRVDENVDVVNADLAQLQDKVDYSNHAVTLLCGAVAEVAKRCGINNGRYTRELDSLARHAPLLPAPGNRQGAGVRVLEGGYEPLALEGPEAGASRLGPNPAVYMAGAAFPSSSDSQGTQSPTARAYPRPRPATVSGATTEASAFRDELYQRRGMSEAQADTAPKQGAGGGSWFSRGR